MFVVRVEVYCFDLENVDMLQEKIFSQIFDETDLKRMSDDEYQMYEESLKHYRDLKNSLDTAFDEGKIEGEQIGLEKGEQIGLEKGEQIGLEKGKIETALNLKKLGVSTEIIMTSTGLSKDDIDKL